MKIILLAVALMLMAACGSGSGTPDTSVVVTQNNNQNQNSQNGDAKCTFECEPVQVGESVGFAVSEVCEGAIVNGPNFQPSAPAKCNFVTAENEFAQPGEVTVSNDSTQNSGFDLQGEQI